MKWKAARHMSPVHRKDLTSQRVGHLSSAYSCQAVPLQLVDGASITLILSQIALAHPRYLSL